MQATDASPSFMQISYRCASCGGTEHQNFVEETDTLKCTQCAASLSVVKDSIEGSRVEKCMACPSIELFVRKDFPQRLGVTIVGIGLALSCVAWYYHAIYWTFAILFATALIDLALFMLMGDVLECYRCHAQYRGIANLVEHDSFDLEIHEKYRQQDARLKQLQGSSASVDDDPSS